MCIEKIRKTENVRGYTSHYSVVAMRGPCKLKSGWVGPTNFICYKLTLNGNRRLEKN
jgi:hypothetical protein